MVTKFLHKPLFFLFIAVLPFSVNGAASASDEAAYKFVEKVSTDALGIITSNHKAKAKEKELTNLFLESVDTKWIAKFVLGRYWREATKEQRSDYIKIHQKFLLNHYVPKFREYTNQKINVKKAYLHGTSKNEYIVETQIIPKDGAAINIDYKLRKAKDGSYKIYDVIAEGVSLIITQRSDFASILSRGGVDDLISKLHKKI